MHSKFLTIKKEKAMGLIKRFIYGGTALVFILMGGFGTQSNSMILQCGGFIGLVIGLVILYIFGKMAWRAMGCLPSFLVIILIALFVLYAIGGFNGGVGNIGQNIQSFFGQSSESYDENIVNANMSVEQEQPQDIIQENSTNDDNKETGVLNLIGEDKHPIITENFLPKPKKEKPKNTFNPMNYPAIEGVSNVVKGDVLTLAGRVVKLFGVAAPDISQTCADGQGRGYRCGQQAVSWLSGWLANNNLRCHILGEDERGILTGVCMLGQYDIGAALINSGWAVADVRQSKIYLAYQEQASQNRRGLWQGKFYMPWDWEKIKARKANVKIIKPKSESGRKSVWSKFF